MNSIFLFFIIVSIIAAAFRTPWGKGVLGEWVVNIATKILFDKNIYHLIRDVTLPTSDGTTQIDHIIVSIHGIFVLETKNMKGWIFGSEHQATWTQKIYKHTNKFQNPLRQNYKHTKAIETLLRIDPSKIHSIVVFVGDSTFKTPMPSNVVEGLGFIRYIKSKTGMILDQDDCKAAITIINERRLDRTRETHQDHVEHLRQKHGQQVKRTNTITPIFLFKVGMGALVALVLLDILSTLRIPKTNSIIDSRNTPSGSLSTSLDFSPVQDTVHASAPVHYSAPITDKHNVESGIIYQWKDNEGRTHYSNVGVPPGYESKKLYPRGYKFSKEN